MSGNKEATEGLFSNLPPNGKMTISNRYSGAVGVSQRRICVHLLSEEVILVPIFSEGVADRFQRFGSNQRNAKIHGPLMVVQNGVKSSKSPIFSRPSCIYQLIQQKYRR
nr:unnamed protein product [Fasciola hepatica]